MHSNIRPIYEFYILVYVYRCISIYIPVYTYQKYSSVRNVWVSILFKRFLGLLYLDAWDAKGKIFTKDKITAVFTKKSSSGLEELVVWEFFAAYRSIQWGSGRGNPNQAPRSTYILYVQKRCTYMFNQLCSVQRSTHERKKREWVGGVGQLIGWCCEVKHKQ